MVKTSYKYINEFSLLDDVMESLEECNKCVGEAVSLYNKNVKQIEMKSFFESVDDVDILLEKEEEGLLTKVGNAIINIIQKFADFIRKITDKFASKTHLVKSDVEKVNQMMIKNPDLKNKVCEGLDKKWFTYKDVAQYEKDIVGLMLMLEKNSIDHKTFKDKVQEATDKFNKSAQPIISAGVTLSGLLLVVPKVTKAFTSFKNSANGVKDGADNLWNRLKNKFGKRDAKADETSNIVSSTLSTVISNITKEGNTISQGYNKLIETLGTFVGDSNE